MSDNHTHQVVDNVYHPEEDGFFTFFGTEKECYDFVEEQAKMGQVFTYQVQEIGPHVVDNIDTSDFKEGDELFLGEDGSLITK